MSHQSVADDFFDAWQTAGDQANLILAELADPPSHEVFEHGLEQVRDRAKAPIDVRRYARSLVDNCEPVQDEFADVGCGHPKLAVALTFAGHVVEACPGCDFVDGWPSTHRL